MPTEAFPGQNELTAQGRTWADLTPSDTEDLPFVPKAVHVSSATGGTFVAIGDDGTEAPFYGAAGAFLAIRPRRILATGLTPGLTLTGLRT